MSKNTRGVEAPQQYGAAHTAHYVEKDLTKALKLYLGIVASHPETVEAGYSRRQIKNIAHDVVPEQELLAALLELAHAHLSRRGPGKAHVESDVVRQQRAQIDKEWDETQRERRLAERERRAEARRRAAR